MSTRHARKHEEGAQVPLPTDSLAGMGAVVFDFDGTLADTQINFAAIRARLREYFVALRCWEEGLAQRYILEMIESVCSRLSVERAFQVRQQSMAIVHEEETTACRQAALYPGVAEALRELDRRGYALGIFTRNSRASCELVLSRHPLPYSVLLTRDDVERVKPDPQHLKDILSRLGCPANRAVVVGDHPSDMETAVACGAYAVGVLTTGADPEALLKYGAQLVLESAADLPRILPERPEGLP